MKARIIITFMALFFGISVTSVAQNKKYRKPYHKKHYHRVYHRAPAHPGAVVVLPLPPRPPRPPRPALVRPPRPVILVPPAPPRPRIRHL